MMKIVPSRVHLKSVPNYLLPCGKGSGSKKDLGLLCIRRRREVGFES